MAKVVMCGSQVPKFGLIALVCAMAGVAPGGTPVGYYNSANTATSATLRSSLNDIATAGHTVVNFFNSTTSFNALDEIDEDPTDPTQVRLIYGGDTRAKHAVAGTSQDASPATGGWDREHIYPQSFYDMDISGDGDNPMVSDLHALMACDADLNGTRSNKTYDNVVSASYTDIFGNRSNSNDFEPGSLGTNNSKGRAARAALYMDVRYEAEGTEPNLVVQDSGTVGTGQARLKYLSTLLNWHRQYPPDAFERTRNSKAYNYQKNANPFVDHPEWVAQVYDDTAWQMEDGTTLTVSTTNRAPVSALPTASNVPLLGLNLSVEGKEWHVQQVSLSQTGTATDAEVTNVSLYHDVDNNGIVSSNDSLLSSTVFTGGNATLALAEPFYLARGTMNLLVAATPSPATADGKTIQVRLNANGIIHSSTGGTDIDPVFANASSSATIISPAGISMLSPVSEPFAIGSSAVATLPTHWRVDKQTTARTVGTYAAAGTATELLDGVSVSTTAGNGIYNFGSGTNDTGADRAIGFLSSGTSTKSGNLYVKLTNDGTVEVTTTTISYDVEKYRKGSNAAGFTMQMYHSPDGVSWTSAGANFLTSFVADADNAGYSPAPGATSSVASKELAATVPVGGSLYLAWNYSVSSTTTTSNAQALSIDNVSINPAFVPVTLSGFSAE